MASTHNLTDVIICQDIPVIDLNFIDCDETVRCICDACMNFGFFQVTNIHGKSTTESISERSMLAHQFNDKETIHSWRKEYLPSYESVSEDQRPNPRSNSGSNPAIILQGVNGSNDYSIFIKRIGNITCECDGFFQVCIYMPLPATAHTDDHDHDHEHERASSSPTQQHVTLDIHVDDNKPPEQKIESHLSRKIKKIGLIFKELEIGKTTMGYALPALVALSINAAAFPRLALHVFMVLFLFGVGLIWNGIMLRDLHQRLGCVAEQVGVVIIIMGCFGLMASVLHALLWAPLLIGILLLIPYFLH